MQTASEEERFEAAAHYRDLVRSLEKVGEKQRLASVGLEEEDYVAFHREADLASVQVFQMRGGHVQGRREFSFEGIRVPDAEFLADRSEERRVGKECRARGRTGDEANKG